MAFSMEPIDSPVWSCSLPMRLPTAPVICSIWVCRLAASFAAVRAGQIHQFTQDVAGHAQLAVHLLKHGRGASQRFRHLPELA